MSNYLAIATVTEALRITLDKEMATLPNNVSATAVRPDVAGTGPSVNVFLYQVTPNAAQRNSDLPTRDAAGVLRQRPRAALDLHYLLSVYGNEKEFEPHRILGMVVRTLHSIPVLTEKAIEEAKGVNPAGLLFKTDLLDAEHVRFTPLPLSLEELSKIWSVLLTTKYALSVAYLASPILIEPDVQPSTPLPVRTRAVSVMPSFGPEVLRVRSSKTLTDLADDDPIVAGRVLHVIGRNLDGKNTRLRIGTEIVAPPNLQVSGDQILFALTNPPIATLRAGISAAQVIHDLDFPSGNHPIESNAMPFVLAPRLTAAPVLNPASVDVTVAPPVKKDQQLALTLNRMAPDPPLGYRFPHVATADGAVQSIPITVIEKGTYLVRLQVDGAESPLDVNASGHYTGPKVVKP